MLRTRALIPCVTVGLALGAAACNLTPDAMTTDSGPGTETGTGTETTGTSDTLTTGVPTTTAPTTGDTVTTVDTVTTDDTVTDPTTDDTTTGPPADEVSIYDIQGGLVTEGTNVTVKGVVITSPIQVEEGTMFVQETGGGELSGISVYMYDEVAMAFGTKPGIVVDITGEYTEFFGESQIKVVSIDDITQVGEGEPPAPEVVSAADIATGGPKAEAYEGVLVAVENVTVTDPAIDIGEFQVDDSLRISDFFLFPLGQSPQVIAGQQFTRIAGPLRFSFDNHKLAPRNPADLDGEAVPGGEHTIYEIQQGMVPLQAPVLVKGAIVTSPLTFKKDGFFIQDPMGGEFSAIYVYVDTNMVTVAPGDVVDVEGTYDEFFDFSQIEVTDPAKVTVTGQGAVPAPVVVDGADVTAGGPLQENYESVLVTVENVQVAALNEMFGEYELTSGLFVDDLFLAKDDWTMPMVADMITSLTGPLAYGFNEVKLSPRTPADIVP